MRYFRINGKVHAYDDAPEIEPIIPPDAEQMTPEEVTALQNPVESNAAKRARLEAEADQIDNRSSAIMRTLLLAQLGRPMPAPALNALKNRLEQFDEQAAAKRAEAEQLA